MPTIPSRDADIHYEVCGNGSPVMLIAGLGGVGQSWAGQIPLFAARHQVIVPDHRGTGRSTPTAKGQTIAQHAEDFARIIEHLGCGPTHLVGSSTGGAIAQVMGLDHAACVRSATIASSWGRVDAFFRRQFEGRARMMAASGLRAATELASLFLFDPRYHLANQPVVEGWIESALKGAASVDIALARMDMILAHDVLDRLPAFARPAHVMVGAHDFCTPPHLSEQLAAAIPGALLTKLAGGHLFYMEHPQAFHAAAEAFIAAHEG